MNEINALIRRLDELSYSMLEHEHSEQLCNLIEEFKAWYCRTNNHEFVYDQCGAWQHQFCIMCGVGKYPDLAAKTCGELRKEMGTMGENEYNQRCERFPGNVCFELTNGLVAFDCPGCECMHAIDPKYWTWNGSKIKPSISPSILVRGTVPITDEQAARIMLGEVIEPVPTVCHSYVTDGVIEFLGDCTHKLAGQKVPLKEFE